MIDFIKKSKENRQAFFRISCISGSTYTIPGSTEYIQKYEGIYDGGWEKIREQRFEKQKELGIWPANMSLPQSYPTFSDWNVLPKDEQKQKSQIFAAHAGMIEDMDYNIGKLIQFLKDTGQYDNTLIMFTSDNGGSEPSDSPVVIATLEGANEKELEEFKAAGFQRNL